MYWILVFVVVSLPASFIADLRNPHLPWRSILEKDFESKGRQTVLCKLPAYPKDGGYVVVDRPDAKPGQLFQNVSLVQYKSDNKGADIVVQAYQCAGGEWSKSIFKYDSEFVYFNTSWCPIFCASFTDDNNITVSTAGPTIPSNTVEARPSGNQSCILPPYPTLGGYYIQNQPDVRVKPGDVYNRLITLITYEPIEGSELYKISSLVCSKGFWYRKLLKFDDNLLRFTKRFWCPYICMGVPAKDTNAPSSPATTVASDAVELPRDSSKSPSCQLPPYPKEGNYTVVNSPEAKPGDFVDSLHLKYSCYSDKKIVGSKSVYCVDGVWSDELPKCVRCGSITWTPGDKTGDEAALRKELPWHSSVYTKKYSPYRQICSGTIIATNFVVTAAHCFWSEEEGVQPASQFAVAAGKIRRPWDDFRDAVAQKSDVAEIRVSPKFRGSLNYFKDDIALLVLTTPLPYDDFVSPICLDFDVEFDEQQLTDGSFGKIASWSSTGAGAVDDESSVLQVGWLPYVTRDKCVANASPDLRAFITGDKICAGDSSASTGLCVRDGGAGFAFQVRHEDATRVTFYLRGILSVSVSGGNVCNSGSYSTFTHTLQHEAFLKDNLKDAVW